ncbi:MAG: hypothetical protein ACI9KE_001338, partial [Polyangiales bacterium]
SMTRFAKRYAAATPKKKPTIVKSESFGAPPPPDAKAIDGTAKEATIKSGAKLRTGPNCVYVRDITRIIDQKRPVLGGFSNRVGVETRQVEAVPHP